MTHPTDKQAQDVVEGRDLRTEHQRRISAAMKAWWRRRRAAQGNVIPLPVEQPFGDEPEALWHGG